MGSKFYRTSANVDLEALDGRGIETADTSGEVEELCPNGDHLCGVDLAVLLSPQAYGVPAAGHGLKNSSIVRHGSCAMVRAHCPICKAAGIPFRCGEATREKHRFVPGDLSFGDCYRGLSSFGMICGQVESRGVSPPIDPVLTPRLRSVPVRLPGGLLIDPSLGWVKPGCGDPRFVVNAVAASQTLLARIPHLQCQP